MRLGARNENPLARCHGYVVVADDGWLGDVETPLFGSDASEPEYLAVHAQSARERRLLLPTSLVRRVDVEKRLVRVQGDGWQLARLPATLPLSTGPRP